MAKRIGYCQVEPNHMSGMVTGQILAQLPVDLTTMGTVIENGRFAKYDYANGAVNLTGDGEWMMIYNEEKLPDERKQMHKDFAMVAKNYTGGTGEFITKLADAGDFKTSTYDKGEIVPRLMSVLLGDIFTTNAIHDSAMTVAEVSALTDGSVTSYTLPAVGTTLYVGTDGYLATTGDSAGPAFNVVKAYNMADGQPAVKVMRIK